MNELALALLAPSPAGGSRSSLATIVRMHGRPLVATALAVLGALAPSIGAQTFVETFTANANQAGWTWGNGFDGIEAAGGNPGPFLRNPNVSTFAPEARSTLGVASPFTGNYRARRVVSLGVDVEVLAREFNYERNVSLLLRSDAGTPADPNDDCYVYTTSATLIGHPGDGWRGFDFAIPAQATTLPPGWSTWSVFDICPAPDIAWNNVITNVTQVRWMLGDPTLFYLLMTWDLGLDNVRIAEEAIELACPGDGSLATACPCGNSGGAGRGCAHSSNALGAALTFSGAVEPNSLVFDCAGLPPNAFTFFVGAIAESTSGAAFGDGVRCFAGKRLRFGGGSAHGGSLTTSVPTGAPGITAIYQAVYRDPSPSFCTPSAFNASNGVRVHW